jgi:hypothetical protein
MIRKRILASEPPYISIPVFRRRLVVSSPSPARRLIDHNQGNKDSELRGTEIQQTKGYPKA